MTAPDVAALADALHEEVGTQHFGVEQTTLDGDIDEVRQCIGNADDHLEDAAAIIAALAAQGWRITSAPEPDALGFMSDDQRRHTPDLTRPPTKRIGEYTVLVDGLPDRALQAAVAAALEAAVERMEALWLAKGWFAPEDSAAKQAVIAAIREWSKP